MVLVLTQENAYPRSFVLKSTEGSQVPLKNGTGDLNSTPFKRSGCFYMKITGDL